jgi:hypothetical protein
MVLGKIASENRLLIALPVALLTLKVQQNRVSLLLQTMRPTIAAHAVKHHSAAMMH